MSKYVVVVESPSKAKTINKYLGTDYTVLASFGHIRDLPAKNGSVDPQHNFNMIWEIDSKSQKHVAEISKALKNSETLLLATDPDREGEAISWHVLQVLKEKNALKTHQEVKRIVFNEITKDAVKSSLNHPRDLDANLINAYLARRALDYLVGFNLSPVLWRKLPGSRSAGRVQSVALRLIVDREQEIEQFTSQEYWSINGLFANQQSSSQPFDAKAWIYQGKKVEKFTFKNESDSQRAKSLYLEQSYRVESVESKQIKRHPSAPFITSTLQQEASRKLGFGTSRTMQLAQKLYEGIDIKGETQGLITYMRTDSPHMSKEAIKEAREYLTTHMNSSYVPKEPKIYKSKSKNAQEAHECIRPTKFSMTPHDIRSYLDDSMFKLYELIWKRALSSQMEGAIFNQVSVMISNPQQDYKLKSTGTTQIFDGFLKLYQEGKDEPSDDDKENTLPPLQEGQNLSLQDLLTEQHFTQPPPRYSEASLVKKMEELGIGRPSTYASLIQVLQDRNYVVLEKKQFSPEDRGRIVTSFLTHYFPKYVEYDFTAQLEEQLDDISSGTIDWLKVLSDFWNDFTKNIQDTSTLKISEVIDTLEQDLQHLLYQGKNTKECPVCHEGTMNLKLSKYGAFIGCSRYPECKNTRAIVSSGDVEANSPEVEDKTLGKDPVSGKEIYLKKGPYGFYIEWQIDDAPIIEEKSESLKDESKKAKKQKKPKVIKPKRVTIPSNVNINDLDLKLALQLSRLPYAVGYHPDDQEELIVNNGRFGPYVKHGSIFASIPKAFDYLHITHEQALEILELKKNRPPRRKKS